MCFTDKSVWRKNKCIYCHRIIVLRGEKIYCRNKVDLLFEKNFDQDNFTFAGLSLSIDSGWWSVNWIKKIFEQGRCSVNLSCTGSEEDARVLQLWAPPHQIVFERVVRFEKRLACIMNIFNLIQEFNRLSRLELSAMGGRSLTLQIQNITQQFGELKTPIISSVYGDCMDPDNDEFDKGAAEFNQVRLPFPIGRSTTIQFAIWCLHYFHLWLSACFRMFQHSIHYLFWHAITTQKQLKI